MADDSIIRFKNKVMSTLISNDKFVPYMGNEDIGENDEAIYQYIFPYYHIPDTIQEAHSFVCMKVSSVPSGRNELQDIFTLQLWIIVNQSLMKVSGVGGATRLDYLDSLAREMLDHKDGFGIKELRLVKDDETDMDEKHRARRLVFTTADLNKELCGAYE